VTFSQLLWLGLDLGLSRWFRCGEALNEEPPQLPIEVLKTNSLAGRAKKKENPRGAKS